MSRRAIRLMKRMVMQGCHPGAAEEAQDQARAAAVQLLERSIRFGHERLSVVRLVQAVQAGAAISDAHWAYCRGAALAGRNPVTLSLFLKAAGVARPWADSLAQERV